jgi:uncharacterized protein YidB (DUF937 family)
MAERLHTEHAPKKRSKGGKAHEAGDLATPIAVAVGALVLGKMFGGDPTRLPARFSVPTTPRPESVLRGLSDLIGKLATGGAAPQVSSWIGPGPIQSRQLGSALGQNTLNELSQRTGMSRSELLHQLAAVLPQLIRRLTPNGRMPTLAELEKDDPAGSLIYSG